MPNPLKYIEHGGLYFVTSRTEEGLPFIDGVRFNPIFESILARAQALYPVVINGYVLMANHFHLLLMPEDPEQFPLFVGYVKQELAHAVNRINGRKKKTIWCEGYDSPILLGFEEAIHYHTYLYTQPQNVHIARYIENYRGANSWNMLISGTHSKACPRRLRTDPDKIDLENPPHKLTISPYSWLKALKRDMSSEHFKELLVCKVREVEDILEQERREKKISIRNFSIRGPDTYLPEKRGKRTYCICWNKEIRISFLKFISDMVFRCREVFRHWKAGLYNVLWPPGFFSPSVPRRANMLPT